MAVTHPPCTRDWHLVATNLCTVPMSSMTIRDGAVVDWCQHVQFDGFAPTFGLCLLPLESSVNWIQCEQWGGSSPWSCHALIPPCLLSDQAYRATAITNRRRAALAGSTLKVFPVQRMTSHGSEAQHVHGRGWTDLWKNIDETHRIARRETISFLRSPSQVSQHDAIARDTKCYREKKS